MALHRPLGIDFLLAIIRIINRKYDTLPPFPPTMSRLERMAAGRRADALRANVCAAARGLGHVVGGAFSIIMFGPVHLPPILPANPALCAFLRKTHTILAYLLFFTFLAHLGAVLFHTLVIRDRFLNRMAVWPVGSREEKPGRIGNKGGLRFQRFGICPSFLQVGHHLRQRGGKRYLI